MTDDALRQRCMKVLHTHFQAEIDHNWDTCLRTFNGRPNYEIMATGQVYDGDEEVLNYHRNLRIYLDIASLLSQIGRVEVLVHQRGTA
jgi:hypothetical protein